MRANQPTGLKETLLEAWRQVFAENAKAVVLGTERYPMPATLAQIRSTDPTTINPSGTSRPQIASNLRVSVGTVYQAGRRLSKIPPTGSLQMINSVDKPFRRFKLSNITSFLKCARSLRLKVHATQQVCEARVGA